ncbi:ferritin-like domain-containing protein [Herbiconiux moechotypicola]|uniref:Ferritin-like fold-containing protein n=1 Tax=Herbiconiux moechotypicola TaxID=637393 RepID=A0ABP5QIN4_9MICO|nr:ferritin-like domain-containing protein [Herbiconiux moechotypicola]MCS5730325.1 ferritin-like domain-containing protein [Herbiconiux moechotypicola]
MFGFLRRPKVRIDIPRLKPRDDSVSYPKVNLAELTPEVLPYLGQAAYVQLAIFEEISDAMNGAPTVGAKQALAPAAGQALDKHERLVAEIRRRVDTPSEVIEPFVAGIDRYRVLVKGSDWYEQLASVYLTAGILDDFFTLLAAGLPGDIGPRCVAVLDADTARQAVAGLLGEAITDDPVLGSRLAMWGRRVVGDTLLVCRSAIHLTGNPQSDEQRIEPVFTEMIAAHTRRMDGLGLTA